MLALVHGDCLAELRKLPAGAVDMVLADLPYGTTQNKWDSPIDLATLWAELDRVCKRHAAMAFTASQPFTSALVMSKPQWFRHEWVWIKNRGSNFGNTVREPMKEHESVLIFARSRWTYNKQMQERTGGGASRVAYPRDWNVKTANYGSFAGMEKPSGTAERVPASWQKFNTEVGLHPTQKPLALYEYLVKTYTNAGDVVLDPCAGSGTAAIACLNLGRRCVCIEREANYFATMSDRVASHETKARDLFAAKAST